MNLGNDTEPRLFQFSLAGSLLLAASVAEGGTTNPLGGGGVAVGLYGLLGYPLVVYLLWALAARTESRPAPGLVWLALPIALYLAAGFPLTYASEDNEGVLHLYAVLVAVIAGTLWLALPTLPARIAGIFAAVLGITALNYYNPKLVDFYSRSYINNLEQDDVFRVLYEKNWRVMDLTDGRRLLNLRPPPPTGPGTRYEGYRKRFPSPVRLTEALPDDPGKVATIHTAEETRGVSGWASRANPLFVWPLLGEVTIERYTFEAANNALVLNRAEAIDCRYLYIARDEPVPADADGKVITWDVQSNEENAGDVACETED